MKNAKTTIIGISVAILLAVWGVFQPAITGGHMDLVVLIPSAVIAVVGILDKDLGSWKTTTISIILSALGAGATTYLSHPMQWVVVIGAMLTAIGGALMPDKPSTSLKTGITSSAP